MKLSLEMSLPQQVWRLAPGGGGGGSPPAEGTIDLIWDGDMEALIPAFAIDFPLPEPEVGDVIKMRRSATNLFTTYDEQEDTVTSVDPVNPLDFVFGGNWSLTTHYVQVLQYRSAVLIDTSNIETVIITGDITAPTLSGPIDTAVNATTGSGSVTTNEADGTLYWVVSTSATPPSAAQVKLGQTHTGAAATDSGSQVVSVVGSQSITGGFTGLSPAGTYYAHFMHEDTDANQSSVSSGNGFSTPSDFIPTYHIYIF